MLVHMLVKSIGALSGGHCPLHPGSWIATDCLYGQDMFPDQRMLNLKDHAHSIALPLLSS